MRTLFETLANINGLTDEGYKYLKKSENIIESLLGCADSLSIENYFYYVVTLIKKRTILDEININLSEYEYLNAQF